MKCLCALLIAAWLAAPVFAQNADGQSQHKIDSLLSLIKPDSPDSVKAKYYNQIARIFYNPDDKEKYALLSLEFCRPTDYYLIGVNYNLLGIANHRKNNLKEELSCYKKGVPYLQKAGNPIYLGKLYKNIGLCYNGFNHIDSMLYYMNQALELGQTINDTAFISDTYRTLSEIYSYRKLEQESMNYIRQALVLDSLVHNRRLYAIDLSSIALFILDKDTVTIDDLYEAKKHITKAMRVLDTVEIDDKYFSYGTASLIYIELAKKTDKNTYADSSLYYYKKAEPYIINTGMSNYRMLRMMYVDYLTFYKKYKEALKTLLDLENTLIEESSASDYEKYHRKLKETYLLLGNYEKAYEHTEKELKYSRANLNSNTMNSLANAKAEQAMMVERMDRENAEKLHAAETQKMRIVIFSLTGGMVSVLAVIVLILRVLSVRKRANNVLAEQKKEIETQRDHIEAQNKEIQASINYARRIQRALLTPDEAIASVFPDYFLLYKPRSVVSGDFYWVGQFGDNKVCIVADCTGHGVPGGFMSVLGMTNLNYIVGQDIAPEAILNKLRDAIMWNLRQNEGNPEELTAQVLDGMDVAAYVVNERKMTLSFAGANNPLVLIRDGEVQVIKPDKMPVGISVVMKPFQSVTMELHKGDCLYTYSDGFQDQFNIESEKKFQKSRLRDLLLEIHQRPMNEQRELLNLVFKEWRGPAENQTDDVVIMGVRI